MTLARACLDCGQLVRGNSRCWDCERTHDRARGTRQERSYTAQHDQLRAHLVAALDPWAPCPRCGHALGPDPALLDLMHNDDRTAWLGLGHRRCNRVANAVLREDSRGARLAKEHKDSKRRIDAAVDAVMAHDRAAVLAGDRGPSIYV